MRLISKILGLMIVSFGFISFLVLTFVLKTDGKVTQDLLGFTVNTPPTWTVYLPYIGTLIDYTFQLFSVHGIFAFILPLFSFSIGFKLLSFSAHDTSRISPPQDTSPSANRRANGFIPIMGENIYESEMPILYKWAQEHPDTLELQLRSIADKWHQGDIVSAMQALESDLSHQSNLASKNTEEQPTIEDVLGTNL